jgi:hypothetical protein
MTTETLIQIQYAEPLTEHTGVMLPSSLKKRLAAEAARDKMRYKVNNRLSEAEVQRCALRVFFRLLDQDPDLFHRLRDNV